MSNNLPNRKRHISQPVYVKQNALKEIKNGANENDIAEELNVNVKTVKNWKKQEEKFNEYENCPGHLNKTQTLRIKKPKNKAVDDAVWDWFQLKRKAGIPISGMEIRCQALVFHKKFGGEGDFCASSGWLQKFNSRHNIRSITINGEQKSADEVAAEKFIQDFSSYVMSEHLSPHQVFNCDETGLNYKTMPRSTLASKNEVSTSGFKVRKERITLMACSNAAGSLKLQLVVIGKSEKPRCLRASILSNQLPVYYRHQKSAWMVGKLFTEWFNEEFVPTVSNFLLSMGLPAKAVLLVDNCSAHPAELSKGGSIKTLFLPPNTTALIQPMDQGILQCVKLKYRQKMMKFILQNSADGDVIELIKNIDLKNAVLWAHDAWEDVSCETIQKSWKAVWPNIMEIVSNCPTAHSEINISVYRGIYEAFLQILRNLPEFENLRYQHIEDWVNPPASTFPDESLTEEEFVQVLQDCDMNLSKNSEPSPYQLQVDDNIIDDDNNNICFNIVESSDGLAASDINYNLNCDNYESGEDMTVGEVQNSIKKIINFCGCNNSPLIREFVSPLKDLFRALDNDTLTDHEHDNTKT